MRPWILVCAVGLAGCMDLNPMQTFRLELEAQYEKQIQGMAQAYAATSGQSGPAQRIEAVESFVRSQMKDPDSAKFSDVREAGPPGGQVVCGTVNAKNSYGGYTGGRAFIAGRSDVLFQPAGSDEQGMVFAKVYQKHCGATGA